MKEDYSGRSVRKEGRKEGRTIKERRKEGKREGRTHGKRMKKERTEGYKKIREGRGVIREVKRTMPMYA